MTIMQEFKHKLNELLFNAHMTRTKLANEFNISPRTISRWNTEGIPQYAIAYLELKAKLVQTESQNKKTDTD